MPMDDQFLSGWNIVLVDDDLFTREAAAELLAEQGALVHTAENGEEGLALVERIHPKFVLTDLSMPVLDGIAMIEALKQSPHTSAIPIIALTAHAMDEEIERATAAGCHSYITKPLTAASFKDRLMMILDDIPGL